MVKYLECQKGFTLAETVVTGAMLSIAALVWFVSVSNFQNAKQNLVGARDGDRNIAALVGKIASNPGQFQTSFLPADMDEAKAQMETVRENLPLAFEGMNIMPASECPACEGRMGIVMQTVPTMESLSTVTVFIKKDNDLRTYRFLTTP